MNDFSILMPKDYEYIDDIERGRWYSEEIDGKFAALITGIKNAKTLSKTLSNSPGSSVGFDFRINACHWICFCGSF
jgi:hypothetical protein